jgi:hypothetical protein
MRCCQNKTSFSWSYRDSSKRSLENNVMSRRGEKNRHTWERWTCANGKEWSRGTKEVLIIGLHMVGNEHGSFNLEALKFLMHFREPGSLSYGPPWAHYLGGYQDRLLSGPLGLPGCATRHLMAWSTRTTEEKYSIRKLYMSCTIWKTPRRTRLVLSPYSDL